MQDQRPDPGSDPIRKNGLLFYHCQTLQIGTEDVSESGAQAIKELKPFGYQGFLIGENFMKTDNAGESAKAFINKIIL